MSSPEPGSARRWWETRQCLTLVLIATMIPLLLPAVPPLVDLPGHMGRYRVMLADQPALDSWYSFQWHLVGNLGVDLLVLSLAPLLGLELGVKLVILMIPPLTALGMLTTAREIHGRVHPYALFALPLVYNFPFQFGFVNFSLSMALALNAFALWLWLGRAGRLRLRALLFVPIALAIWTCHLVGWGTLGLLVFSAELIRARNENASWVAATMRAALHCLPLSLPFILIIAWRSSNGGGETGGWALVMLKLSWLAMVLRDRWMVIDVAATAVLYMILYKGVRDPRIGCSRTLIIAAALLGATFFIMPRVLFGSAYADMRLAPFVLALALIGLRPDDTVSPREIGLLAVCALALFALRMTTQTASYALYDASYRQELAALEHLPEHARLLTLVGSTCKDPWQRSRLDHLAGLALARRAAFANDQWRMAAAPLLTVHRADANGFANDPSQVVTEAACPKDPEIRPLGVALASFPRTAFDYVWLVHPPRFDHRGLVGLTPIHHGPGDSALYRVAPARSSRRPLSRKAS